MTKFDAFLVDLQALCIKHRVGLASTDSIEVWDSHDDVPQGVFQDGYIDKTKMIRLHCELTRTQAEKLLDHLDVDDAGPEGEGWRSNQLIELAKTVKKGME